MITVHTKSLSAIKYPNGNIKLIVYFKIVKTSGWVKRDLRRSCKGVPEKDFTLEYVKKNIFDIYKRFPETEINQLFAKLHLGHEQTA